MTKSQLTKAISNALNNCRNANRLGIPAHLIREAAEALDAARNANRSGDLPAARLALQSAQSIILIHDETEA